MNITRVFTASVELLFAAALVQRDILSPGPAETFAITFFNWVNFSLTKCLAQSRALFRHLCPIVQQVLETCGSQDRDHRRYLETSWLRAPEHFKSDLLQTKSNTSSAKKIILFPEPPKNILLPGPQILFSITWALGLPQEVSPSAASTPSMLSWVNCSWDKIQRSVKDCIKILTDSGHFEQRESSFFLSEKKHFLQFILFLQAVMLCLVHRQQCQVSRKYFQLFAICAFWHTLAVTGWPPLQFCCRQMWFLRFAENVNTFWQN